MAPTKNKLPYLHIHRRGEGYAHSPEISVTLLASYYENILKSWLQTLLNSFPLEVGFQNQNVQSTVCV